MIRKETQIVVPIVGSSELEQFKNLNIFSVMLKNNC